MSDLPARSRRHTPASHPAQVKPLKLVNQDKHKPLTLLREKS